MNTRLPELVGISYSPWTEKARWALDYCEVPYHYSEHTILLSMPKLSRRLKRPGSEITVPLLILENESTPRDLPRTLMDSFEIARFADEHRKPGKISLFPENTLYEIKHLNMLCESVLDATRALVIQKVMKDRQALEDSLPRSIPRTFRPVLKFMSRMGTRYISKAFDIDKKTDAGQRLALTQGIFMLNKVWKKIVSSTSSEDASKSPFLMSDQFTYADILLATTLQGVMPVADSFIPLTPALREAWSQPELAQEMGEILAWRDVLYHSYRSYRNQGPATPGRSIPESAV